MRISDLVFLFPYHFSIVFKLNISIHFISFVFISWHYDASGAIFSIHNLIPPYTLACSLGDDRMVLYDCDGLAGPSSQLSLFGCIY